MLWRKQYSHFAGELSPVGFDREKLGFDPDPRQEIVLEERVRRGLLNCSRQWGKSTVTAAKAVYRAYSKPESLVLVLSPTARQSGEFRLSPPRRL